MKLKLFLFAVVFFLVEQFVFAQAPKITSFSPASGPVGSLVTINGINLTSPTSFTIGGVAAVVVSNTGSKIIGMVMPGAASGFISLTTSGGTANSAGRFGVGGTQPYLNEPQGNKLTGTSGLTTPQFGYSIAISADGNTAIMGEPGKGVNMGGACVFTKTAGVWTQQGSRLVGSGGVNSPNQGISVAINADGNTVAVGGPNDKNGQGAIWVFTRSAGVWTQQGDKLVGSGNNGAANQGISVAISADGNTLAEGGWRNASDQGAAWVFTRTNGTWSQQGNKLLGAGEVGAAHQGRVVAISADGQTIASLSYADNNKGAIWMFANNAGTWSQQGGKLITSDSQIIYSNALSGNGNIMIVGGRTATTGTAWEFTRTSGKWAQTEEFAPNYVKSSQFGISVSINAGGNRAMIGGSSINMYSNATEEGFWVYAKPTVAWAQEGDYMTGLGAAGDADQSTVALSADGSTGLIAGEADNSGQGAVWPFQGVKDPVIFGPFGPVQYSYYNLYLGEYAINTFTSSDTTIAKIITIVGNPYTETYLHLVKVGTVTITKSNGDNSVSQQLVISPAPLTIRPNDQSMFTSLPLPKLTASYSGFIQGEDTTVLTAKPVLTTTATSSSPPGTYPITASGAAASNYTITYLPGTLTVNPLITMAATKQATYGDADFAPATGPLPITYTSSDTIVARIVAGKVHIAGAGTATITARAQGTSATQQLTVLSKRLFVYPAWNASGVSGFLGVYGISGQPLPPLTLVYSGFINGDNASSAKLLPVAITNTTLSSPPGTYTISVKHGIIPNYNLQYGTVNLFLLDSSAFTNPLVVNYGQTTGVGYNNGYTYTGSDSTVAVVSADGFIMTTGAGTCTITTTTPYTTFTRTLTVNPVPLTITAANKIGVSGNQLPPLTLTYSGFVYKDTPASLTVQPAISTTATSSSPAGKYPITISGAVSKNYTITYVPGTLTLTPSTMTFAAADTVLYGKPDFTPRAISNYPVHYTSSDTAVAKIISGKIHIVKAGIDTITAFNGQNTLKQVLTINPAALTISVPAMYGISGFNLPAIPLTYAGFAHGETQSSLTTLPIINTTATASSPPGTYPITLTGASSPNYNISYIGNNFTLEPASAVTAPIPAKTYGDPDFYEFGVATPGINYTSNDSKVAVINSGIIHIVGAGIATITTTLGSNQITKNITVNPAMLTVTANSEAGISGFAIPALTFSYSGFVKNETQNNLTTIPAATTTATTSSSAGYYPITLAGGTANNYTFNYVPSTLALISQATAQAPIPAKTYGDADFYEFGQTASNVTYSSSNPAVATIVSSQIHITGAGTSFIVTSIGNSSVTKVLTVNPASLTVTADNQSTTQGSAIPPLTLSYSGFVYNDTADSLSTKPTASTTATSTSPTGIYPIAASGGVSPDYTFTYVSGTLTINPSGINNVLATAAEPQVKSAVSPNGDGINDVLTITNIEKYPDNKITLINPAGEKIYEVANYDNVNKAFSGYSNINGKLQQPGTYFYMLQYTDSGVTKTKSGYFVIKY